MHKFNFLLKYVIFISLAIIIFQFFFTKPESLNSSPAVIYCKQYIEKNKDIAKLIGDLQYYEKISSNYSKFRASNYKSYNFIVIGEKGSVDIYITLYQINSVWKIEKFKYYERSL